MGKRVNPDATIISMSDKLEVDLKLLGLSSDPFNPMLPLPARERPKGEGRYKLGHPQLYPLPSKERRLELGSTAGTKITKL
jgi:hypothetical protein